MPKTRECSSRRARDAWHRYDRRLPQNASLKETLRALLVHRGMAPSEGTAIFRLNTAELRARLEPVIPGISAMSLAEIRTLPARPDVPWKPTLRQLILAFGIAKPSDVTLFQLSAEQLVAKLEPDLPGVGSMTETQLQEAVARRLADGAIPYRPRASLYPRAIEDIREEEPGFLKGTTYIQGRLFHAQFIRVKWTSNDPARDGEYNEDGDGEQGPWNSDPNSLCNQWWYSTMVHVDHCAFSTIQVPPFEGHYVLLIHPGSA